MSEAAKRAKPPAFTESQAQLLAALFTTTKEDPEKIITLDDLCGLMGMEKSHVSKILSQIRKMEGEQEIIITTRSQGVSGYGINPDYIVTSALTARILLDLRVQTRLKSMMLAAFKETVLKAPYFLKAGATEASFDFRVSWAVQAGYIRQLSDVPDHIRASQRIDCDAFYLEKIALPDS